MASNLSTICRGQSKRSIILSKQRVISINRCTQALSIDCGHRMQATGNEAGPSIEETCHIHVCQRGPTLRLNLHLVWADLHPCVLCVRPFQGHIRLNGCEKLDFHSCHTKRKNERMKEWKNQWKKECIESHLTRFSFRERSLFPASIRYSFPLHNAAISSLIIGLCHIRFPYSHCQIRSDWIGSRGSINLNVFILCTRFVDTFSTHAAIRIVHACASMCMLPLPVAHPHPLPVAILRQVV